jgi:hypothetical protein
MQRWHDDKEEKFQSSAVRIYEALQNVRDLLNSSASEVDALWRLRQLCGKIRSSLPLARELRG